MKLVVKKSFQILMICMIIISSSCKDSGSPESITELFLISLNQLDYTTMKNISTKNTKDLLKIMESETKEKFSDEVLEERKEGFKIKLQPAQYENDSLAYVSFHTEPSLLPIDRIQLVRVTEKLDKQVWKINISTLDLLEARQPKNDTINESESYDGQLRVEPDSIAVEE